MFVCSSFLQVAGPLDDVINTRAEEKTKAKVDSEYADIELADLNTLATLGVGGFGRVELVSSVGLNSTCYNTIQKYYKDQLQHQRAFLP